MSTTRPAMGRLAILLTLLAYLQPALATIWSVTSYFVLSAISEPLRSTCTESCRMWTYTTVLTVAPKVTPTASPISSRTTTDTYDDVEVVSLYVPGGAVPESDIITTTDDYNPDVYTNYMVPVTWTAPETCTSSFTVATYASVDVPYQVTPYLTPTATSTSTTVYSSDSTITWLTMVLDPTDIPTAAIETSRDFVYSYYVKNCRHPSATPTGDFDIPGISDSGDDGSSGFDFSGDGGDWDNGWGVCSAVTGCVGLAAWIIVVAILLPTIFLLGFLESYLWFRRLMLGKSALRLGTVCWCALSLWFIFLTRKQPARSPEDQALLKQYWATLGAGTRVKLWFKWGFKWKYPVELLGNPDGNNPAVNAAMMMPPPPPPSAGGDGAQYPPGAGKSSSDGSEKAQVTHVQQQPAFMPYPPGPYGQPVPAPGQPHPAPPAYMMPMQPPHPVYTGHQPGQPMYMPGPPQPGFNGQQPQMYPAYVPSPSPAHTNTTDMGTVPSSMQPTPPPGTEGFAQPPPGPYHYQHPQ
ncbi:hypothetical protein MMYC01_204479 [Madurella mycetomatis]|uniref:Uncharacterized protein n=1 Tax=Madurella mycetomatis TaxID=100816 RepID=A0A175W4D5_9PEZI|nr:hypothetical protein MMYC01_205304 [Madurella mycetomatis]KXX79578.1 hypothetical protein MMYC01_204479 [Madurella mycetomatis]